MNCESCGAPTSENFGNHHIVVCQSCSEKMPGQKEFGAGGSSKISKDQTILKSQRINTVVVSDIEMPFMSMVKFMVKWALASIPAFIVLGILYAVVMGVFIGLLGI